MPLDKNNFLRVPSIEKHLLPRSSFSSLLSPSATTLFKISFTLVRWHLNSPARLPFPWERMKSDIWSAERKLVWLHTANANLMSMIFTASFSSARLLERGNNISLFAFGELLDVAGKLNMTSALVMITECWTFNVHGCFFVRAANNTVNFVWITVTKKKNSYHYYHYHYHYDIVIFVFINHHYSIIMTLIITTGAYRNSKGGWEKYTHFCEILNKMSSVRLWITTIIIVVLSTIVIMT